MNKVVSFNRDVEYLLKRASVNRDGGRLLEALKLTRRVVEVDPGNAEGWMEMAQALCEMGRAEQSNRILALMLSVPGAPADCYFGMSCNYLGLGDIPAAFGAMINLISLDSSALARRDVADVMREIVRTGLEEGFEERANRRVDRLCRRARELLKSGNIGVALGVAQRAYSLDPANSDASCVYAGALMESGDGARSVSVMEKALADDDAGISAELEAVKIFTRAGMRERACELARALISRPCPTAGEIAVSLSAACLIQDDEAVANLASKALRHSPFDTSLFHICAVNRVRLGRPIEQAVSFWTRANSIDPDDPVIRYYLKKAQAGALNGDMSYDYALARDEEKRLDAALRRAQLMSDAELDAAFASVGDMRDMCQWGVRSGDERAYLARELLSRSNDPWAKREISECRADDYREKFRRVKFKKLTAISPLSVGCAAVPTRLERAVRLAAGEYRELFPGNKKFYLYKALAPVANAGGLTRGNDTRAWATVLVYAALGIMKKKASLGEIALRLHCPLRRAKRCLSAYEARGGNK